VRRAARVIALALVLILSTVVVMLAIVVYRPHPVIDADLRLLGMHERGEIVRDRYGVPHIFARDAHDLFFMQGYVLAQDRLFQMDLYRRAAHGRLSEVLGEATLAADKLTRTLSLSRAAARDLELLSPEGRAAAEAFAEGVNKFLEQHGESLPLEFLLLGYRPGAWSPVDSIAIVKLQAYDQAVNFQGELVRTSVAQRLGASAIPTLFPEPQGTAGIEAAWARIAPYLGAPTGSSLEGSEALHTILGDAGPGAGSNCWALSGTRTATGRPLFAGDPHLGVRNPSIWYEVALEGAGYKVAGFTIPGVPGVILGHNDRVAWSLTVAYVDQQDLFLERQDPADLRRFLYEGRSEAATVHRELIRVKGRTEAVPFDVVVTRHGPIVTPVMKGQLAPFALRWTALDGGHNLDGILGLDRARDWASFRAAAALIEGPALTLCYADVEGHIGAALVGRVPQRANADDGRLPLPGWTGEHEWREPLAPERNPSVFDPAEGLVVFSNQKWATLESAGSPAEWDPGFRAARVREILSGVTKATADDFRRFQTDVASIPSRRLRDALLAAGDLRRVAGDVPLIERAQEIVRTWDGVLGTDSAAAAIYETFLVKLIERTFKDKLGETLYTDYLGTGRPALAIYELVSRPADQWFTVLGTATQGLNAIAGLALDDAVKELAGRLGADPAKWRWGAFHQVKFDHPLGSAIPFGLLNIGPFERPGDDDTVNDAPYHLTTPYDLRSHASLRTVVDLADLDNSWSVLPTGQSGQPYAKHWGDQTPLWLRGDLKPMPLSRGRIDAEGTLVLRAR